ncbi:MAG: hypothetical protein IJ072_06370, partial [Oscillospiraceae bacterium]|nr:hypothetical protein [Oscillospiraceae bacterium]
MAHGKRWIAAILTLIMLLGALTVPAAAVDKQKGFGVVGAWVLGTSIYNEGADKVVARCEKAGITDIYLLVKGTGGKLGWLKTKYTSARSRTDRDVLQETITAAHKVVIRVHAQMACLKDTLYQENHTTAGTYHFKRGYDNENINPNDSGYRSYFVELEKELINNYDIDGIQFDYIRYMHPCYGWSEADYTALEKMGANRSNIKALFDKTYYTNANNTELFTAYENSSHKYHNDAVLIAKYRTNNIKSFASYAKTQAQAAAKAAGKTIIFSGTLQQEAFTSVAYSAIPYGRDINNCAAVYDYTCPMAYSGDYGYTAQSSTWLKDLIKKAAQAKCPVVMGLQAYSDGDSSVNSSILSWDVGKVQSMLSDSTCGKYVKGIALFRYGTVGYAAVNYSASSHEMTVRVEGPSEAAAITKVTVSLKGSLKATSATKVSGFASGASASVSSDGKTVTVSGGTILSSGKEGTLRIVFTGTPSSTAEPALVTAYTSSGESRIYNAFESDDSSNADAEAAKAVDNKIAAIGTVTLNSESAIKAARKAYDALTGDQKALVTKYSTLTAAEATLAKLQSVAITNATWRENVSEGAQTKFSVTAEGNGLTYQWQYSKNGKTWANIGASIASAKTAELTFTAKASYNGYSYRCVVTGTGGKQVISKTMKLTVNGIPAIVSTTATSDVEEGSTAKFSVKAKGSSLTYQWQYSKDGKTWANVGISIASAKTS